MPHHHANSTSPTPDGHGDQSADGGRFGRRRMLRRSGVAAAAAAGGSLAVLSPTPASATVGLMSFGTTNDAGADATSLTSSNADHALAVTASSTTWPPDAVRGTAYGSGTGVHGRVLLPDFDAYGVWGEISGDSGYAIVAEGGSAQLYLKPHTSGPSLSEAHTIGEVAFDLQTESLWVCVASGNPGVWRKIGGATTAGAFHPIPTARVYDSRWTLSLTGWTAGTISSGSSRVLSVRDKRDPANPSAVSAADVVPVGATAVAFNLTVTSTSLAGNLAMEPGDAATAGGSTINWSPGPLALANGSVVKLDSSRQVKVFCGGAPGNSTHFIIDIVGYYL